MLSSLLGLFAVGVVLLAIGGVLLVVVAAVIGMAIGAASWLLFHVAPLLLVGWVGLKLLGRWRAARGIAAADQCWLDS